MALDHGPRGMATLQALYHVLTKPIVGAAPSTVSVTAEGLNLEGLATVGDHFRSLKYELDCHGATDAMLHSKASLKEEH